MKDEIRTYWMNQAWIERTQRKALRTRYRDSGHSSETPTEYFIRKFEILSLVYNFTPSQYMSEILQKAPRLWSTILNPRNFTTLAEFQTAIKYHEDLLIEFGERYDKVGRITDQPRVRSYAVNTKTPSKNPFRQKRDDRVKPKSARTYAVGAPNLPAKPLHPRDDSNVSKPKTPADYKARGCIFCGSTMHWDRDCKYNPSKDSRMRSARTMFVDVECGPEDILGEMEYERCYDENLQAQESMETESESSESENSGQNSTSQSNTDESENSDF